MGQEKDAARLEKAAPGQENGGIRISTDAMIALVVTEAEERERAGLPSLREMNEAFRPSEAFEKKMEKLRRTVKNRQRLRRWLRAAKRTVVCLTVLVTLLTCAMIPAKAVRNALVGTWIEWKDRFMSIVFSAENTGEQRLLSETAGPAYIPEGFTLREPAQQTDRRFFACYENGDDYFNVRIALLENGPQINIDNEYTSFYTVRFQDHDAIWAASEKGMNTLVWIDRDYAYFLSGTIDLKTLIQIAENIKMSN